jgi:hypothetical protein
MNIFLIGSAVSIWLMLTVCIFLMIPIVLRCLLAVVVNYGRLYEQYSEFVIWMATPIGMTLSGGDRYLVVYATNLIGGAISMLALFVTWHVLSREPKPAKEKSIV